VKTGKADSFDALEGMSPVSAMANAQDITGD
jgi:hypothetical protein